MTRYTYSTGLSFGGDTPTAEFEVTASFLVDWHDGPGQSGGEPDDIRIEAINGRPVEPDDKEAVEASIDELYWNHAADMMTAAHEQAAEANAEAQDRRDEANHERAWSDK